MTDDRPLVLDGFSCAGLGADGYEAAGYRVVCADNDPKALKHNPHESYLVDVFDVLRTGRVGPYRLTDFALAHWSPPCQGSSATRQLAIAQGKGKGRSQDLITPLRALLDDGAAGDVPWIVENVNRSQVRHWPGAVRLCGSSFGLKVERHRWFAPSPGLTLAGTECRHADAFDRDPVTGKPRPWGVYYAQADSIPSGGRTARTLEHGHQVMGVSHRVLPWRYLCEGLPPVMTEHLGRQVLAGQLASAGGAR